MWSVVPSHGRRMCDDGYSTEPQPQPMGSRVQQGKEDKASDDQHAAARKGSGRSLGRPSTNSPGADLKLMSAWPDVTRNLPPTPGIAPGSMSSDELLSVNHGSF
jgi:hypothetical protein